MKAIVYTKYGPPDVLQFKEVEKPVPGDNEVLVKVQAAAINAYDLHLLKADPFIVRLMGGGLLKPKKTILGADIAGRVETVGKNVVQLRPGDEVLGGVAQSGCGGFAQYVCTRENALVKKPPSMSFVEAAAIPMAALTALQGLRDYGKIKLGQKVLINGASGGVGTFAVQIAKSFGAEVTAVCSPRNVEKVRYLGADRVIDYTREDFTKNGQQYDLIFAANGYHSVFAYRRALAPKGIFVVAGGSMAQLFQCILLGRWMSKDGGKQLRSFVANENQKDLDIMKTLFDTGKVKPVIDRRYTLSHAAEAFRYLDEGHAAGKVVITMEDL